MSDCPKCKAELPRDAPAGLCPRCLVRAGFDARAGSDAGDEAEAVAGSNDPTLEPTAQSPPGAGRRFDPPSPEELASAFPQLEIVELLGQGGMGTVYKARQTNLDRPVALKIIRPEAADDPAFAERFNREARTLARLSHANIVAVHDFGEVALSETEDNDAAPRTLYYFLMEYVDGANLRQLIRGGQLESEQALAIIPQICEALQFAHDEGVVHRDIKPENILVDTKGRVKIADFGLARLVASSPEDFTLTGTHQVMGTPRYMAPEQMSGSHAVDHRADIYSLGVVFYEMLTGEVPLGQFDPPSKKAPVDGRLDEIVLRALATEPERRFQQADEMKSSVEKLSSYPGPHTGVSTFVRREMQNAWRWIAGDFGRTARQRQTLPALLMIAMSVVGGLMFALPWMDLEIDQLTTLCEVAVELERPVSRTFDGYDMWSGGAAAVAFAGLALLLITTPTKRRPTVFRSATMTGIAALAVLFTLLFRMEVESETYPVSFIALQDGGEASAGPDYYSAFLNGIEHRITYRPGFIGSIGLSVGLLLLSATGIRHAAGRRDDSPETSRQSIDPPLTSIRFTLDADRDIAAQVVFHFTGLGYRLIEERPSAWVFQRGNKYGGLWAMPWGSSIRSIHTTLTVSTAPGSKDEMLVSCVWAVRTLGAWIRHREIETLETEGHQLASLLTGGHHRPSADSPPVTPTRFSVGAIVGGVLSHLLVAAAVFSSLVVWHNRIWFLQPIDWTPLLLHGIVVGTLGATTTLVGALAVWNIRRSRGRVAGLGLAFAAAVLFPLLLLNAAICGLCHLVTSTPFSINSIPATIPLAWILTPPLWLVADLVVVGVAWSVVSRRPIDVANRSDQID